MRGFHTRIGRHCLIAAGGMLSVLLGMRAKRQQAEHAAVELRQINAHLEQQAAQRAQELERVLGITKVLTSSLKMPDVLDSIIKSAFQLYPGLRNAHVFLYQHGELQFGIAYWLGERKTEPLWKPRKGGLTSTVAETGQLLHIPDMQNHPIYADSAGVTGEIVGLPLKIADQVVGVVNLSYPEPNTLTDAELRLLQLLGDQMAIAIEHANLYNSAQQKIIERQQAEQQLLLQNAQMALIQMTMLELLGHLDPHKLLESILGRAGELLSTNHGYIYLLDPSEQQLTCAIGTGLFEEYLGTQAVRGLGIAGAVWETHQPVLIDDYDAWPQRVPSRPTGRVGQIVGIPLLASEQLLGVLGIAYPAGARRPFGERELELLSQFAHLASIALQNLRLVEAAQRRAREAETLREAGGIVAATLHQEEALTLILEQLRRVVNCDEASVMLVRDNMLVISATTAKYSDPFPMDQSSGAGLVINRRAPMRIDDVTNSPDWLPVPEPTRSWLGVPLIANTEVIGVLNMGAYTTNRFTDHDCEVALSFASHAVIAIENARLFADAQRRAREAETLREAGAAVATTLNQEETIRLILEQLRRVVNFDEASVMLLEDQLLILSATTYDGYYTPYQPFNLDDITAAREVIRSHQPILIPDTTNSPLWSTIDTGHTGSWLGVPLIAKGQVIGVLNIGAMTTNRFTEHDQVIAFSFADQVAIAIENAKLYSSAQQEIAERRRAEEQLRQAKEEAEAATRIKSEFLATMSHEIRTPMNGVLGMADVLLDNPLSADQRSIIETIRTSGDRLLRVIDDILDFSKIEAGQLEIEQQPFDLPHCLQGAFDIVTPRARAKGLTLTTWRDPSTPRMVIGDPTRLQQILINLLGNAIKFTDQGEIEVTLACEQLDDDQHRQRIICAVHDTGIGIPPERMDRLFQSFSQVDASTTRRYGGTGLGLAICKQLCELMGGEIWAESTPGVGSIFSFTMLVGVADQAQQPEATAQGQPAGGPEEQLLAERLPLRLLLAEDHPINQRVMHLMLKYLGYHADLATNGLEALERLRAQTYDLVLMDIQMPELDGLEASRQIRAQQHIAQPIIIALTANAMQGDRERCLAAGMNDYLSKPIRQDVLRQMLERWGTHIHAHSPPAPPAPLAPTAEDQPLNQEMIAEMRAAGALDELIALFHAETPALLDSIRDAIARDDHGAVRKATHMLRGSSSYLGAIGIVAQAQVLEQAALAEDLSQAPALLAALERAYEQASQALQEQTTSQP